jgi:hypothetical protein
MSTPPNAPATASAKNSSPLAGTAQTDDVESLVADESANLKELSFDDDSRSDRHRAIGSSQSAQNDNAPDENIDEEDEGNDIAEQEED